MTRQRPVLLTVLAILAIIFGAFAILGSLALFGLGAIGIASANSTAASAGGSAIIVGVLSLVGGILELLFGIGTLLDRAWAWWLGVIGLSLSLLSNVVSIVLGAMNNNLGGAITGSIVGLVVAGLLLYYLNTSAVKAYFGRV
jgi:hypothetical protein